MFSDLKPEEFARKLQKAFGKVKIAPKNASEWKMDYSVNKSDPDGKLITGIECGV